MPTPELQQFYIAEEQSIYLLKADDARKHRAWIRLCKQQLSKLGYSDIELVGKGAYGFVFAGVNEHGESHVFKFSRITLPRHIQDRLEDEAHIISLLNHPHIPPLVKFEMVGRQGILVMQRAKGEDLEQLSLRRGPLSPGEVMEIARQLADILVYLRVGTPLVHGDIKPSNLMWDESSQTLSLIDWGSAVFAQRDENNEPVAGNVMNLLSGDQQHTNARMGDVYFIGEEQLNAGLSSPRFDEQGVAGTLFALASGLPSRFGSKVIPPTSLGLPRELARILKGMLNPDATVRNQAGAYFLKAMSRPLRLRLPPLPEDEYLPPIPVWTQQGNKEVDTVSYSSRKSFLRVHQVDDPIARIDDFQLDKYYRNFMAGMGDTEKGFLAALGRLGHYPIMGGLALHWQDKALFVDSNLALYDPALKQAFSKVVGNMITLARGIQKQGTFKACFFNARDTLHITRDDESQPFVADENQQLPFEVNDVPLQEDKSRLHSYFEDGRDPDESLELPAEIMAELGNLNQIHHTGCIIFEVLPTHMKIHSYFKLLNPRRHAAFRACLDRILNHVGKIQGYGVSGFMKLPYKNTRKFNYLDVLPERFYPKNPRNPLGSRSQQEQPE
ncbi:MAG: protein kinase [Shewanella sp.]|nr:protein kinase [Shewanella sp.]MCF1457222.1 protein kinase [Shewanella sp.]